MYHPIAPTLQKWYQDAHRNEIFKVIAKSLEDDFVEIQYFSGEIAELDFETWFSLHLNPVPPPEDSSGPFELSQEELGYDSENKTPTRWPTVLSTWEPSHYNDSYTPYDSYDKYEKYDRYEKYFDNFDRTHFFKDND